MTVLSNWAGALVEGLWSTGVDYVQWMSYLGGIPVELPDT
jgi:hypothetical protein